MKKVVILFLIIYLVYFANFALADFNSGLDKTAGEAGYGELMPDGYSADPAGEGASYLVDKIGQYIGIFLTFIGVIFLFLIIYGGYIWMIAKGNEQEVEKARNIIKNALIGLIIILIAYAVTYSVTEYFYNDTTPPEYYEEGT